MAWWSLYKWFVTFRKKPYFDWNIWYRQHLYEEWFKSLSEEDQKIEIDRVIREKERDKKRTQDALMTVCMLSSVLSSHTYHKYTEYTQILKNLMKG